jgi:dTMP kinase
MKKQKPVRKKGLFIVIEGIDGSGKTTQYELLKKKLESLNFRILTAEFPRYYSSTWGKLVGRFLSGEFGDLDKVSPYLAVLTYMMDQYTWSRDIGVPWIRKGGWILTNRYFTSNIHQIAKLKTRAQKAFREWLWPAGYDGLGILRPDLVIFIDTTPRVAKALINNKKERSYLRGKRKDIAEKDWNHQVSAYREYKRAVKAYDWWVEVPGVRNPSQDFSDEIHKNVWKIIADIL